MAKENDEIWEAVSQVYEWSTGKDGKPRPPYVKHPLPEFVNDRIKWAAKEMQENGMISPTACIHFLLDIDDEEKLKSDWEIGAVNKYMPVAKEYKEWLETPWCKSWRKIAVALAFVYWGYED